MRVAYNCKFCHKPGFLDIDDNAIAHDAAERWFPMLCCDRCGNFRERLRNLRGAVAKRCNALIANPKEDARSDFERLTKKICSLVCDHYRVQDTWRSDFVDLLIEKPRYRDKFISSYISGIANLAKK